jgi:hypothetical protein
LLQVGIALGFMAKGQNARKTSFERMMHEKVMLSERNV